MPTDEQGLLGVHKWDFHSAVDWWKVKEGEGEKSFDVLSWEDEDKMQHMSVRWRCGGKGKPADRGERKAVAQLVQGGGQLQ
jgi:hypothetical protein